MFQTIRNWLGKKSVPPTSRAAAVSWVPQKEIPTSPLSSPQPEDSLSLLNDRDYCLPPTGSDPRILFPILCWLRDYIPDVSAGVWSWVRLCSTQQSYSLSGGNESDKDRASGLLANLDRRLSCFRLEQERGVEALIQSFFLSVFTYGSFCGEVVLDDSRRKIDRFVVIDPATVRFKRDQKTGGFLPFQIHEDSSLTALNPASFFYYGLDTDGLNPYGRSPLLALRLVVKLQQQLLSDMAKAQHNAGYPTIHFKIKPSVREPRETPNAYNERLQNEMNDIREAVRHKETDSNLVTFDNVEINYIAPNGNSMRWSESIQAIGEQVISALHLAPFMIGRNWGTTQSWGTAQYQLLTNNARTVQEGAKRLAEWLRNLELILNGLSLTISHHFAPHHHLDIYDRARAFKISAETLVSLTKKGIIEISDAKQRIETLLRFF